MSGYAICSRRMQFCAGPQKETFHACAEHQSILEAGDVMLFYAYEGEPVREVDEEEEVPCHFCREGGGDLGEDCIR